MYTLRTPSPRRDACPPMSSSQVLVILLLIVLNGFFVLSEMALVSAKRSRLQTAAEQGVRGAKSALALVEDPTTLLSAVQIGITLLTIFTGLYGGETFAGPLAEKLTAYGVPTKYTEELAKGIVVLIITFVTLIVGEVVPKRVALLHAETLALRVAPLMRVMARVTAPAVWMLRVALASIFVVVGFVKIPGSIHPMWVRVFERIGFGQWFRYFTALVEIVGGMLMIVPSATMVSGLFLASTMVGALLVHISVIGVGVQTVVVGTLLSGISAVMWHHRGNR